MNLIESTLLAFFDAYSQQPIVVAYSGGVDSQVLLTALAKLKNQQLLSNEISACHINHGLSQNAKSWQAFAHEQCQRLAISLNVYELNLVNKSQQSLEAIAREARYDALVNNSKEQTLIVTGHHLNDQAETLLLALKRGAGIKGMSAMGPSIPLEHHTLARPLLSISRNEIINYAREHQLEWIEDESNQDEDFDRNFIRHSVIPLLTQRWPSIEKTLSRSANNCQDAQVLLDEVAIEDLQNIQTSSISLSVSGLVNLSPRRFNNAVRYFLSKHNKLMPSSAQLKQLLLQLNSAADKNPAIKINDYYLRRFKTELFLTPIYDDVSNWCLNFTKQDEIVLPDNMGKLCCEYIDAASSQLESKIAAEELDTYFSADLTILAAPQAHQTVSVRFSHHNPKCLPHFRDKSRSLKKILQESNIATWQRQRIPFIYYDDVLVAALGVFVCKNHLPTQGSDLLKLCWLERN